MARDQEFDLPSKCSNCDEETNGYPVCVECGEKKPEAWCKFCKEQLRPLSILGNWKMCINCGARGDHYTTTKP